MPNNTDPAGWSDEQIWDELDARFALDGGWKLERGPITSKSVTPMQIAQLDRIATSQAAATELAENYTGLPIG